MKEKRKTKKSIVGKMFVSLLIAFFLFIGLVKIESKLSYESPKGTVIVAVTLLNRGAKITEDNFDSFFRVTEMDESLIPGNAIKNKTEVIGQYLTIDMDKNEVLNRNKLGTEGTILSEIEDVVEVSLQTSNLAEVVGGVLRKGDFIDVSMIDENGLNYTILEKAFVFRTFNNNGEEIDGTIDEPASMINLLIDRDDVKILNESIETGKLRISRKYVNEV